MNYEIINLTIYPFFLPYCAGVGYCRGNRTEAAGHNTEQSLVDAKAIRIKRLVNRCIALTIISAPSLSTNIRRRINPQINKVGIDRRIIFYINSIQLFTLKILKIEEIFLKHRQGLPAPPQ